MGRGAISKVCTWLFTALINSALLLSSEASSPPFFYACNYQGSTEPVLQEPNDVILSVSVEGNPEFYVSQQAYRVTITSSRAFNGILVTGLYSAANVEHEIHPLAFAMSGTGGARDTLPTSDYVCGTLYSDIAPHASPTTQTSFDWTAPPAETGCISFLLTGSIGMGIIFQDVLAFQICEEGRMTNQLRPDLADVHSNGMILRDDFDSEESVDTWSTNSVGVSFFNDCGEISHGKSAVFCGDFEKRELLSLPLDLASSSFIQFTAGTGSCNMANVTMSVSYQLNDNWIHIKSVKIMHHSKVHLIHIPAEAKNGNVSLKFSQEMDGEKIGCFGLDNVLVPDTRQNPTYLYDDMDPIDESKWFFIPGANIKADCMSHRNAMIFSSTLNETGPNFAVTRDVDLSKGAESGHSPSHFEIKNGVTATSGCNHVHSNNSVYVFNGSGKRQICASLDGRTQTVVAVQFHLSMGSGECQFHSGSDARIEMIGSTRSRRDTISVFFPESYKREKQVKISLPHFLRHQDAVVCLEQVGHHAQDSNVWAIDSFELIQRKNQYEYYMQFALNTICSATFTETKVQVEYSNDYGASWTLLQEECLPETCHGRHWTHHSKFNSLYQKGWTRVNLPLPMAALTEHTRFRWIQVGELDIDSVWGIDDIYIGSKNRCPNMCNGHGTCTSDGCKCDSGWIGLSCNESRNNFPGSLSIDFRSADPVDYSFDEIYGGHVGYECGVIGNGKALVFNGRGKRSLVTKPHNGSDIKFLQFAILMGRHSSTGTCRPPKTPGDGVLVQYTINNGMTWHLLNVIPYDSERRVTIFSVPLPSAASVPGLQVRWMQPNDNEQGEAVWAMDDIILSSVLYKSIYSAPEDFQQIYTTSVSFHTGLLTNYCNRSNILLFSSQPEQFHKTLRYAETQTMETSEGVVLEADVNLRCSDGDIDIEEYDPHHELFLEYSKDEGATWHLVLNEILPGSTDEDNFHPASIYHASEYERWKTAVIPLPRDTWSSNLRLRVVQNKLSTGVWALDNVYMGPACPMHCRGRGRCRNGICMCDKESFGPSCLSRTPLPVGVSTTFSNIENLKSSGWRIIGASVRRPQGALCGAIPSQRFLHFHKHGVRKLETNDMDTTSGGSIQFYIQLNGDRCEAPAQRSRGILLQYSNNGGVEWEFLNELYYLDYTKSTYVHRDIPTAARSVQTRFRWWQPDNTGDGMDTWSIGDIIVGDASPSIEESADGAILKSGSRRRAADDYPHTIGQVFNVKSNVGNPMDFCEPYHNSLIFNKIIGDRFASTVDYSLAPGDTIQFEINIGCSNEFSWDSPVYLQYSHDEGYSWELVQLACYPQGRPESHYAKLRNPNDPLSAYDCTGAARELVEPSIYYRGSYPKWRRVVIKVTERVSSGSVRLRWWQHVPSNSTLQATSPWAIRSVYIGMSCPEFCNGHGVCSIGIHDEATCICDKGYSGAACSVNSNPISGFWEHFAEEPNSNWWNIILGVIGDSGCGDIHDNKSLNFGSEGVRLLETVSLNTRPIRMIQFYLKLGGESSDHSCTIPEYRDESVLLQYSNDNGISWKLIKELTFDAYNIQGERVIVNIPLAAKTESTSFRWWQPLRQPGKQRSQWSIDDVFIGGPDILEDGFADDFNSRILSDSYWYSVKGSAIGQFERQNRTIDSHGYALVVTSVEGKAETWDFKLGSGSFIQFDLILGCGQKNPAEKFLNLEYSDDLGLTWKAVIPDCPPARVGCDHGYGSHFYALLHQEWKRQYIALPEKFSNLAHVRFRWTYHHSINTMESAWAIDNVYIGNGCPWMCNGHGQCWPDTNDVDTCSCDINYGGKLGCRPEQGLPRELEDSFDQPWQKDNFVNVIGGEIVVFNNQLINGESLEMRSAGIRLLQTISMNTVDTKYLQFHLSIYSITKTTALIIQASRNGGITWSTLHTVYSSELHDTNTLIHIELSQYARFEDMTFRIWQSHPDTTSPTFDEDQDVWSIDNMIIGGMKASCNPTVEDDLTTITTTWLHNTHTERNFFCDSSDKSIIVGPTLGEHSITTKDLCISENYVIQFNIAVGCDSSASDSYPVRLEYSADHGVSWHLVNQGCLGQDPQPSGCSDELHPPSIYYPGTTPRWRRVIIPLKNLACGSIRFRWMQGYFSDAIELSKSERWALNDVYIGPSCEQDCNGHGICSNEGETCICDSGFGGATCCDITIPSPVFLQETFNNNDGHGVVRARNQFSILSGGRLYKDVFPCTGTTEYQWVYKADGEGERILDTRDLDIRDGRSLQFYITFDHIEAIAANDTSSVDYLHVQFSSDGGISWKLLESLPILESQDHEMQYISLELPEESRTNATRIRWWHPKTRSGKHHGFSIDQIFIGGPSTAIDDHFEEIDYSTWIDLSGAQIQPEMGSECCTNGTVRGDSGSCDFLEVGMKLTDKRNCNHNFAATNGVKVLGGSYISFDLTMNCGGHGNNCEGIELQYSTDIGKTWATVIPSCYPGTASCTRLYPGSIYVSDIYSSEAGTRNSNRIIVPLPSYTWSPFTRFRWLQTSQIPGSWMLDNIYIGSECPGACLGRGKCHKQTCICDEGWAGSRCQNTVGTLPAEIKEVFVLNTEERLSKKFVKIVGGQIDDVCGHVGFNESLRFFKSCSRLLQTVAMDTSHADFIQFFFRFGCGGEPPSHRNEGVLLDYTTNGGAVWHNLGEMYFKEHHEKPSFINIALPDHAKTPGTQFRWWQPQHSGIENQDDWAIDSLFIGGKIEEAMLSDDFNVQSHVGPSGLLLDRDHSEMWQFYDNTELGSFCGRDNVILGGKTPGLDVTVSTKDFVAVAGFMIQYTIAVLCEDVQKAHQPVHVQYSLDFGDSWQYLVNQCTPADRECFGNELTQPSAHFISSNWRRKTIWIPEFMYNRHVRFRFHQIDSDVVWGLDRIYVGPACPDACSGHGDCVGIAQNDLFRAGETNHIRNCLCELGYAQPNCHLDTEGNKKYLKDDFNTGGILGNWFSTEPTKMDTQCGIVFDGNSLSFSGVGPRQVESADLDLRDATYIQFYAVIGRNSSNCLPASTRKEGILMQYSIDAGITWHLIRELDYKSYLNPTQDYVNLPLEARTNSTRVRWWQPFQRNEQSALFEMGENRASWALDNVIIGGNEVNDFSLSEDFEISSGALDETKYHFYPNGQVGRDLCPGESTYHMAWMGAMPLYPKQSLTTRQLIIIPGHMIQFKIKVGCGDVSTCSSEFPVRLEYREEPGRGVEWELVKPECHPNSVPSPFCIPYFYHDSSTYKLEYQNVWKRVTIPLNQISSDLVQFRWIQNDAAPESHSWAIDDVYIGESCPNYCSGHGRCSNTLKCICDPGFTGEDCATPWVRYLVPVFRDAFESTNLKTSLWSKLAGGNITTGGCGPFRSYGFANNVYFYECGERQLVSRELDLTKAWNIQYVLQFGSRVSNPDCRIYQGSPDDNDEATPMSTIVLQYTTNNGIIWHTLREHWPGQYSVPRRVSQPLPTMAKTRTTIFRWWQPTHHGYGYDQWALDNVDISMTRRARHNHFLDYRRLLALHQRQTSGSTRGDSSILKSAEKPVIRRNAYGERLPPNINQ